MFRSALITAALSASLCACGSAEPESAAEPGPVSDADKTPAQIEEDVAAADTATLEQTLADYKAAIAAKKSEIEGLEDDLEGQVDKTLGDLGELVKGDSTKVQEMTDDATALEQRLTSLQADLEDLRDKMKIYKDELASR